MKAAIKNIASGNIWRDDFPILGELNRGKPLIYLDTASSAQKPQQVIDAMTHFYSHDYANIHRGIYELSERSTLLYEQTRIAVKDFIHAKHTEEIIFVHSTTEGINLVAQCYGRERWQPGDEIIISEMEHHSNIVPWLLLKEQIDIELKVIPVTDEGALDIDAYRCLFSARTKFVAITQASNVLGTINPVKEMIVIAHEHGVPVLIDGAQAIAHGTIDVQELDCDFYGFSGHKLYGPTGIGVLYGKKSLLDAMPPYQGGGSMIESVSFSKVTFAPAPQKFEAGTPNMAGVIGLKAAIDYVQKIGMQNIFSHDQQLLQYTEEILATISDLRCIGTAKPKLGVISFILNGIHPHDIGTVLDHEGIAIRAGHHCAMPLMARFKIPGTVRVSFGIYNNADDIAALGAGLSLAKRLLT